MSVFIINKKSSGSLARTGHLFLPNGVVQTPVFMPIGTVASVKSLSKWELEKLNFEIILGNTYHLWLNPDLEILAGGLHSFSAWNRPILTDSGGFQAFSLAAIRKFDETGVSFKVPKNGQLRFLSPEISMKIQTVLGSDIALVLDECLPAEATFETAKSAMERTFRWAARSQTEWQKLQIDKKENQAKNAKSQNSEQDLTLENQNLKVILESKKEDLESQLEGKEIQNSDNLKKIISQTIKNVEQNSNLRQKLAKLSKNKKIYKPSYQKILTKLEAKFSFDNLKNFLAKD